MTADHDAIRARLDATTPGPWTVDRSIADVLNEWVDHPDDRIEYRGIEGITHLETGDGWYFNEADATFIAHAPTDIADLLAENERLRADAAALADALWALRTSPQTLDSGLRREAGMAIAAHEKRVAK